MKQKIKSILLNIDDLLASISVALIVVITVLGVFMRYVVKAPLKWTEEVSLALFVWFIFFGASSAVKRKAHISIDILVDRLSPKATKCVNIFIIIINTIILGLLAVMGFKLSIQAGLKITPILKLPYTYIDIAIPLGCILMIVNLFGRFKNEVCSDACSDESINSEKE